VSGSTTVDTSNANGTTSITVTKPTGSTTGDLMIATITIEWGTGAGTITTPTGWTLVGSTSTGTQVTSCFQRLFQTGDTSWSFPYTAGAGTHSIGVCFQTFTGCDTGTPIDATGTASNNTSGTTITANAVTVATANAWELIALGCSTTGNASATGFTALNNAGSNEQSSLLYNQTPKSTGSTGTVSCTIGGGGGMCIPFAIRPLISLFLLPYPLVARNHRPSYWA
jgi:hypothetical protein